MIAISGATGHLGRLVIGALGEKIRGAEVVALARTPAKAGNLGIAVREADYDRPGTLATAFSAVDTLLLISGNEVGKRVAQHQRIVDAAKQAGVARIVYTSILHADRSPLDLADDHRATERSVQESGIPHTILRNGWYTENYISSIAGALAGGAFIGSAGSGRISSAAREDYAAAAAAVLTTDGHEGKTYELAGDEAWTMDDLAAEVSRQTGRTIPYKDLPQAEYAAALEGFGLPSAVAHAIAGWDVGASNGALYDDSRQLSRLIGRNTTPLSAAVRSVLQRSA
jgi:NAD(P)H dehydrogenase (quinone)